MIKLYDAGGNDLLARAPAKVTYYIPNGTYDVTIYADVVEEDECLPYRLLTTTLDWNDGSQPSTSGPSASPITVNQTKKLGFGAYAIKVTATNNRMPTADSEEVTFYVSVEPIQATTAKPAYLFGPILPKDTGLPNRQTWLLDRGTNVEVLASSIKMLLLTSKGERVMQPTYGTGLRRILFELNIDSVESIIQQEIATALATWEPRVTVQSVAVNRNPNARNVSVVATFASRTLTQPFDVQLSFGS
jgi:hypothetical protein